MNTSLFFFFYNLSHKSIQFDAFTTFIAGTFDRIVLVFAAVYLLAYFVMHKDWKNAKFSTWLREAFIIGTSVVSAWFIAFIIKISTQVARPFAAFPEVIPLVQNEPPYQSFPSAHSTIFFALATAIYLYDKRAGIIFYVFAVIIAISRVVAGVHYPLDIAVGAFLGIFVSLIVHKSLSRIFSRN